MKPTPKVLELRRAISSGKVVYHPPKHYQRRYLTYTNGNPINSNYLLMVRRGWITLSPLALTDKGRAVLAAEKEGLI